jgi:hypothetical protein
MTRLAAKLLKKPAELTLAEDCSIAQEFLYVDSSILKKLDFPPLPWNCNDHHDRLFAGMQQSVVDLVVFKLAEEIK